MNVNFGNSMSAFINTIAAIAIGAIAAAIISAKRSLQVTDGM